MFENLESDIKNRCEHCRWYITSACPHDDRYIGRKTFESSKGTIPTKICHRFVLTEEERHLRWQNTMNKLHENLTIDFDD